MHADRPGSSHGPEQGFPRIPAAPRRGRSGRATAFGLSLLMLLCAVAAGPTRSQTLHPDRERISDEAIAADERTMDALEATIGKLERGDSPQRTYRIAKAKAWLELARAEYRRNDRTGLVDDAFEQAAILAASPSGGGPTDRTAELRGTQHVRADLWAFADSLRTSDGFRCAAEEIAQLEVQLVRVGNEELRCRPGDRRNEIAPAEQLAARALEQARRCVPPVVVNDAPPALPQAKSIPIAAAPLSPSQPIPVPTVSAAEAQVKAVLEKLAVLNVVHFDLNASTVSAKSAVMLDSVVAVLKSTPDVRARLWGHTDPRGSVAYNLALGRRRANAVKDYLVQAGVEQERLMVVSAGKSQLESAGSGIRDHALNRRVELQYEGPGGMRLEAKRQERDLQLEAAKKPAPKPRARVATARRTLRRTSAVAATPARRAPTGTAATVRKASPVTKPVVRKPSSGATSALRKPSSVSGSTVRKPSSTTATSTRGTASATK